MKITKKLNGKRFGRLTVLKFDKKGIKGEPYWLCKCDCGKEKSIVSYKLTSGNTQSCGCLHKEHLSRLIKKNTIHGRTDTRLYKVWDGMRQRCNNPKNKDFKRYGKRGITVCDDWNKSFTSFYEWSMENGYDDSLTLDRIDVNGNYTPSNCRWVTIKVQGNNRRNNRMLSFRGRTMTMREWSDSLGIPYGTLKQRIYNGWSIERALTSPVGKYAKKSGSIVN